MFKSNLLKLRKKMNEYNVDLAVITDDDSLYYFTGYQYFVHMEFGRPTILLVPKDDESTLITPLLDVFLVPEDAPVKKIVMVIVNQDYFLKIFLFCQRLSQVVLF